MPKLTVRRRRGGMDRLRAYRVLVDGVEVGRLRQGQEVACEVAPGRHVVEATIDWCRAPPLQVSVADDDVVVEVGSGLRGWQVLLAVFFVSSFRGEYLRLERVP